MVLRVEQDIFAQKAMMKKIAAALAAFTFTSIGLLVLTSCHDAASASEPSTVRASSEVALNHNSKKNSLTREFKEYWYQGEAEISSFELEQARYGEIRKGHAVHVFVTEPFSAVKQVKADYDRPGNIPVLKLNTTKKYLTGIYPYSIMTSSFYPVSGNGHAVKVSNSVQEWCGQVYTQLNNREQFDIMSHSYFEGEADQQLSVEKTVLEDELWNMIRIQPGQLPTGKFKILPSLEFIRVSHIPIKAYEAVGSKQTVDGRVTYSLEYPELGRTLQIIYAQQFPYGIEEWTDTFRSGFGSNAKILTSRARKIKTIKAPYWRMNSNKDSIQRSMLKLP